MALGAEHVDSFDTIAAVCTARGRGGVGVIRISGGRVPGILEHWLPGEIKPRCATFRHFYGAENELIDQGLVIYFKAPHSFTGEEILELHGHGGPVVMDLLLARILSFGIRLARPGEFSERAYLNNKMDLAQAEAVADLIDAQTRQAALSASRSLLGVFSDQIQILSKEMMYLRMYVEAAIDFPDEEVDFLSDGKILSKIEALIASLQALQNSAKQGQLLKEGLSVAIVGQPNAGKSSLLNALTQHDSAIVTPIAGTTRDLIKESIQVEGMLVHLVDTAGIRSQADMIEQAGIERSQAQQRLADRILLLVDGTQTPLMTPIENNILREYAHKVTVVINKIDLIKPASQVVQREYETVFLSAKTGEGIEDLKQHFKHCAGFQGEAASNFSARRRHLEALSKAFLHCEQAREQLVKAKAGELVAEEIRFAQEALGDILGKVTTEDVLGEIFSNFCIGK